MKTAPRTLAALLGAATLVLPAVDAASAASTKKAVVTKKLSGDAIEADRWGTVQIDVTVRLTRVSGSKKMSRKYVDLGGRYSYHSDRSQYIMSQALPMLRQEFLQTQNPNVQVISGATVTSEAFARSLQSALLRLNA